MRTQELVADGSKLVIETVTREEVTQDALAAKVAEKEREISYAENQVRVAQAEVARLQGELAALQGMKVSAVVLAEAISVRGEVELEGVVK